MALFEETLQTGTGHQSEAAPAPSHQAIAGYLNDGTMTWLAQSGELSAGNGVLRFGFPVAARVLGVSAWVTTPSSGASIIVDIHKISTGSTDMTSMWATTQANRPTIAAGAYMDSPFETAPDENNTFTAGQAFRVDIDNVGSSVAGSDLSVGVRYMWDV